MTTATDVTDRIIDPDDDDDGPGWASTWIRSDPARAVGVLLIVVQAIWRTWVGINGFMSNDDFTLAIKSVEQGLTRQYLFQLFNNHMMPLPNLYIWWVTKTFGYVYWPYLAAMILCQLAVSIVFFRLLRQLIPASWGLLIPLAIFLFSPLNLESTSWWVFGMYMLPMELAMVWAMSAQIGYVRTRRIRHLVSLFAALVFGFASAEKALLIPLLVFGFTACFLVKGSPGRSIWRALTRYWQSWVVLIVPSIAYYRLYQQYAGESLRRPESIDQVITFFKQIFGQTLIPGLLGGPWTWLYGTNVPVATPTPFLETASLIVAALFIVYTVWRRPRAWRAWILCIGYALLAATLIASTRMGLPLSWFAGMVTRYTSDIVVVAALCIGVAIFGVKDVQDRRPARRLPWLETTPQGRRTAMAVGTVAAIVLAAGCVYTTSGYRRAWSDQPGRAFYETAQAELAKVPPDTVFIDEPVGSDVIAAYFYPYNMQSRFFKVLGDKGPHFVGGGENPRMFTDKGYIKPVYVKPIRQNLTGPDGKCGYAIKSGQTVDVPLDGPLIVWPWALRIAYLSDRDTPVSVRLGPRTYEFTARQGLHQYFFGIEGGGQAVQITASAPGVDMCVTEVVVGEFIPWLY